MPGVSSHDAVIIGAGIAGCSLAYFLAERGMTDIVILEREEQPGTHATGRSAATLVELDEIDTVLKLKIAAAGFFRKPPAGFCENPLLDPRGVLGMFQGEMWDLIQIVAPAMRESGIALEILSPREVVERYPAVAAQYLDGGLLLTGSGHLDVHELLWSYLRHARRKGALLRCSERVEAVRPEPGGGFRITTGAAEFRAALVVNAAGAWAGRVAGMAGALPIKLTPLRRTIVTFPAPEGISVAGWPLLANYAHKLYFGPEARGMLASPMDEDPMEPCDARPDDLVVAQTMDRLSRIAPGLMSQTLLSKWAGLRTFAEDRSFVVGEDPGLKGFFWLAGQGGSGIETSPAVGRMAADLILDGRTQVVDASPHSPARFGSG